LALGGACRSDLYLPAINEKFDTIDKLGVVGGQEQDCVGDVLGLTDKSTGKSVKPVYPVV
jgi:hypothetical protein